MERFDCIIIGGGVVGAAIFREMTRFSWRVALLEAASDLASGTSGRNSGVLHAGFNCPTGQLRTELCVAGCKEYPALAAALDVPFVATGKLVTALTPDDLPGMEKLYNVGLKNGCAGLSIIDGDGIRARESHVDGIAALCSDATGVTNPFLLTIALGESAVQNGGQLYLQHNVTALERRADGWLVRAGDAQFHTRWVINCAGLYADEVARMAGIDEYHIYPCRGEYYILDKRLAGLLGRPVYPVPNPKIGGLGVHLTITVEGSVLVGPSAEYIDTRDDYATTRPVMEQLYAEAKALFPPITTGDFIRCYAGIRPKLTSPTQGGFGDFVIERRDDKPGFVNLVGIESPGLTSSGPIARMVAGLIDEKENLQRKGDWIATRKGIARFAVADAQQQRQLIAADPDYGRIMCRCEQVTAAEIKQALANPFGVRTLAAVKNRTHAMTGRCQGGYCMARIVTLMQEAGVPLNEIREREPGSEWFTGHVRGVEL